MLIAFGLYLIVLKILFEKALKKTKKRESIPGSGPKPSSPLPRPPPCLLLFPRALGPNCPLARPSFPPAQAACSPPLSLSSADQRAPLLSLADEAAPLAGAVPLPLFTVDEQDSQEVFESVSSAISLPNRLPELYIVPCSAPAFCSLFLPQNQALAALNRALSDLVGKSSATARGLTSPLALSPSKAGG